MNLKSVREAIDGTRRMLTAAVIVIGVMMEMIVAMTMAIYGDGDGDGGAD